MALRAVADRAPEPASSLQPASRFTDREQQVADRVSHGRTNRQIGRTLGIAEKTVESHVHHVIAKLGAHSRTEVAAWVVTQHHRRAPSDRPLHGSPDTRVCGVGATLVHAGREVARR